MPECLLIIAFIFALLNRLRMIIRLHFAILHEFFMSERKKRLPGNPGRRQFVDKVRSRDADAAARQRA